MTELRGQRRGTSLPGSVPPAALRPIVTAVPQSRVHEWLASMQLEGLVSASGSGSTGCWRGFGDPRGQLQEAAHHVTPSMVSAQDDPVSKWHAHRVHL